jgi:hypothetical protein
MHVEHIAIWTEDIERLRAFDYYESAMLDPDGNRLEITI